MNKKELRNLHKKNKSAIEIEKDLDVDSKDLHNSSNNGEKSNKIDFYNLFQDSFN